MVGHSRQKIEATINPDACAVIWHGRRRSFIKIDTESGPIVRGVRQVNAMFHAKGHLAVCGF